ncbi:hypothetical protein Tco_0827924 [Tanacetum coccineum]
MLDAEINPYTESHRGKASLAVMKPGTDWGKASLDIRELMALIYSSLFWEVKQKHKKELHEALTHHELLQQFLGLEKRCEMYPDVEKSVTVDVIVDGNNLAFLRADQMATLDDIRGKALRNAARIIQHQTCAYIASKEYILIRKPAIQLQAC